MIISLVEVSFPLIHSFDILPHPFHFFDLVRIEELNVVFDPLVGYFYKLLVLGKPAAELTLAWNVAATSINAVASTIVSVIIYMALRPALKKAGLFFILSKEKEVK